MNFWEELIAFFPCDTDHIENDVSNNYSILACVFVAAITCFTDSLPKTIGGFSPNRCLATTGRYTYGYTGGWEEFMK
jgi:hypothetical protein